VNYNFLLYIFLIYNEKLKYTIILDIRSFVYFDIYIFDVYLKNYIYVLNLRVNSYLQFL